MDYDRWQHIEDIYHSALKMAGLDRDAFLTVACAGDEELRLEVLSLISSTEQADSFMEEPALNLGLALMRRGPESLVGQSVGRYQLLELLGRGGMGEVYLARDPRLNRNVALKLLPADINDDSERVRRFEQEARAACAIPHSNVAHVYDIGEEQGRRYITMEYVRGQTLRQVLKRGRLEVRDALVIAAQVATALAAAHAAGVIHRDIKPENIMLSDDGSVKVLDFGLAKLVENRLYASDSDGAHLPTLHTEPELLMGTPDYMSPEQVRRRGVDHRTDLWSLGVVLYEMIAGRRPFTGNAPGEVIAGILEREPTPLASFMPGLPLSLSDVVSKALRKRPRERQHSAQSLAEALRGISRLIEEGVRTQLPDAQTGDAPAPPPPLFETAAPSSTSQSATSDEFSPFGILARITNFNPVTIFSTRAAVIRRRWRVAHWLILLPLLCAGLYLGFGSWRASPLRDREFNLTFERLNLSSGGISYVTISPDGKFVAAVVTEGRKYAVEITELTTGGTLRIAPPADEPYSGLTFSPDGTYVYYIENPTRTGTLYRTSKYGGGQRKILDKVSSPVTLSPDGAQIAFTRADNPNELAELVVAQADGTPGRVLARRTLEDSDFFFSDPKGGAGPAWSPDGKVLACPTHNKSLGRAETNIELINPETGARSRLNAKPWYGVSRITWLADSSGLVVAAKESPTTPWQLSLLTYPEGEIRPITADPNNYTWVSSTSDSGVFLTLNVEDDSNIWLVSLQDGRPSSRVVSARKGVSEVFWQADGKLVYVVYDGVKSNLWTQDVAGDWVRQLTFETSVNYRPAVTPDQRYVVFASSRAGTTNIWRLNTDGTQLKQLTFGSYEDMPSVTPDGEWVVYSTGSSVRKVHIGGGDSTELFGKGVLTPAVSPDGQMLAFFINDGVGSRRWRLEVRDLSTLEVVKRFDPPTAHPANGLRWTPAGDGLAYIGKADGTSNIWLQPLDAGAARRLTDFSEAEIQSFSWSPDGKQIACVRRSKTYIPMLVRLF